tara:strand:- start:157 stop:471 length:315 start_codon:yes stop_codon:yes gene_type:complete
MEHQDYNVITFNSNKVSKQNNNPETKTNETETIILENTKLGKLILQSRTIKNETQDTLSRKLGINKNTLKRWENNSEVPSNAEIAKIERFLGVKLPRNKKIKTN